MGLDGGTIVTRSDVLRGQSWRVAQNDTSRSTRGGNASRVPAEKADKSLERSIAWSTCALSSQPLRSPVVACGLGRLYNKDAVLQFLLVRKGKVTSSEAQLAYANQLRVAAGGLDHINSLKDVMEVHLHTAHEGDHDDKARNLNRAGTSSSSYSHSASSDPRPLAAAAAAAPSTAAVTTTMAGGTATTSRRASSTSGSSYVCPITLLPCDRHPCSALRPCGHVLSDRALANIRRGGDGDMSCPMCGSSVTSTLPIHGSPEQIQTLRDQLLAAVAKSGKSAAARKRRAAEAVADDILANEARES
ncbi:hypothetical protein Vretimale_4004 [Volvox reticuliferus]|uniref:Replication termination factor 2 n=1 Tax=Volvox reticuliferus TaxID=1737510 RepID=A0A8J4G115_9CHLO|nr:hypothetical protein Vretifemale_2697 [Volvox reticuliferus]GIL98816.1 hypothetical protein Vretimale_4004 [Volvox reticuliferus]